VIGWLLRKWQSRHPGPALALTLALVVVGLGAVVWWVLRDLSRGLWLRPAIAVLALALVSLRLALSFGPFRK
jgi:hypothetical protein